ncbi:inositol monophosphatase [Rhodotorula sp. JG-1b]|nr:inositol monophosphatase [Rhodotorula sp. JG-1b]
MAGLEWTDSLPDHGLDLAELHRFAAEAAILAGSYLRDSALARTTAGGASTTLHDSIQIKENAADIVTKADMHAEELISGMIRERYPGHKIIGEESYSAGQDKRFLLDNSPTWIIDPLDGTVNFVHLFPTCCVSIGFCVNPVIGGLHLTNASGTLTSAARGLGAWSTSISFPFQPSPIPPDAPKGCLFVSEWGKARADNPESNLSRKVTSFWNMAAEMGGRGGKGGMVHGVRSLGSATLDCVYVATGAADIFWEGGCWEWDVCAGIVLILESGGRVVPSAPPPECLADPLAPIPDADLGGRLYLAIRACSGTEKETAREAQDRLIRAVWDKTVPLDYSRPR